MHLIEFRAPNTVRILPLSCFSPHKVQSVEEASLSYPFLDFNALLTGLPTFWGSPLKARLSDRSAPVVIEAPDVLASVDQILRSDFDEPAWFNYLNLRLLQKLSDYFPGLEQGKMPATRQLNQLLSIRKDVADEVDVIPEVSSAQQSSADDSDRLELKCAQWTFQKLPQASTRLLLDARFPDRKSRRQLKEQAGQLVDRIVRSFQVGT